MNKPTVKLSKLANSIKKASMLSILAVSPLAIAAPGGSFTMTSDVSTVSAGDLITLDVAFSAVDANIVNLGSFVVTWNSNDFALDASSTGTAGDNDPDQTNYLSFAAEQNDDNNRLSLTATGLGFNDVWELSSSNGTHTLNLNRQQAFGGQSAFSNYGLFQIKLIAKQGITAGSSQIVAKTTNIADNQNSNTNGSEYTPATLNVTLSVPDTQAPVITLNGDASINLLTGQSYNELGATASDDVDGTVSVTTTGSVNTSIAGTYTITYTATDAAGNESSETRTVIVNTSNPPVITAPSNISVEATSASGIAASASAIQAFLAGASATDDVDSSVIVTNNAPSSFPEGNTIVTFSAQDSDGNAATATATITVTISDSDNDGLPDYYELANGLDPNDPSDAALDLDGDGTSNLDEYTGGTDIAVDDVAPVFTAPDDVTVDATGSLTAVSFGTVTGTDTKDGTLTATADNSGPFAPGVNTVTWTVTDAAGNSISDQQLVNIVPMVDIEATKSADEGVAANILVSLNGNAVTYPVSIPYTLSGTATEGDDFNALSGTISIASGTSTNLTITTLEDMDYEGDETLIITLGTPTNAVAGSSTISTLTIVEENLAPSLTLSMTQNGNIVTSVVPSNGIVTVTATLTDLNPNDSHTYDWSNTDNNLVANESEPTTVFSFDPSGLTAGLYSVDVSVDDDGSPMLSGMAKTQIRVLENAPELSSDTDTDGDGTSDLAEGYNDADEDRIPDYLDNSTVESQLPVSSTAGSMQTQTGLKIRLGETAFSLGKANSALTESEIAANTSAGGIADSAYDYPLGLVDFEVTGVTPGASVSIVIPLDAAIPSNAVYRKLNPSTGWADFVVDSNNSVASAGSTVGVCPAPGDAAYTSGLTAGDVCIELSIEDGGANDTDGVANGVVADPSGVAVVPAPAKSSGGGGAINPWFLGLLATLGGFVRLRRKK